MVSKFHSVYINRIRTKSAETKLKTSKFHSVYINSAQYVRTFRPILSQNSILFILIGADSSEEGGTVCSKFHSVYINSWTMCRRTRHEPDSKFHSVYINRLQKIHKNDMLFSQNSILFILIELSHLYS